MNAMVTFEAGNTRQLTTRTGKVAGVRLTFAQPQTASQIKAALRAKGTKGAALTKAVNDVLSGAVDIRWAEHDAAMSSLRSAGYIPDYMDARGKGATSRYVRPTEAKAKAKTLDEMTEEELLAALEAKRAAKN